MSMGALGTVAYNYKTPIWVNPNIQLLDMTLNFNQNDIVELTATFTANCSYTWNFWCFKGNVTWLTPNLGYVNFASANTYTFKCLLRANETGSFHLTIGTNASVNDTIGDGSFVVKVIGRGVTISPPTTAPWFDPQNWIETVADVQSHSQKWVPGYKVRYAVTFYSAGVESLKGPWCEWIEASWAMPTLVNVPTSSAAYVEGRNVYRQFDGWPEELIVKIENNTDTRYGDGNA